MQPQSATIPQTLGDRAMRAYDRELRMHEERRVHRTTHEAALRGLELVELIKEKLELEVEPKAVVVPAGEQRWLNAFTDVDDITLVTVGYGAKPRSLHVLWRCRKCQIRRPSLHEVLGLSSLGASLARPRSTERCSCRPGAEDWTTGGVTV